MFIVTAQMVKPVNRDDLPKLRGVDGLKNGSPLGIENKSGEIEGPTGFTTKPTSAAGDSGAPNATAASDATKAIAPAAPAVPSAEGARNAIAPSVSVALPASAAPGAKATPNQ